jgi:hypothetical protein
VPERGTGGRRILRSCHAGCAFEEILRAINLEPHDLLPDQRQEAAFEVRLIEQMAELERYQADHPEGAAPNEGSGALAEADTNPVRG